MKGKGVNIPYLSKDAEALLLWKDPKQSGIVFGSATAAFLFYLLNPYTPSTLLCYTVAIGTLAAFLWAQMGALVSKSGPPVPAILERGLGEEDVRKLAETVRPYLNKALGTLGVMMSGKDMKLSIIVFGVAFAAAKTFAIISPVALAYLVVLLAFTAPKAYELKQDEVDRAVALVRGKVEQGVAKVQDSVGTVMAKIPKAAGPSSASPKKAL